MALKRNIFAYAPKELSHSAFWAWVLDCLDAEEEDLAGPKAVAEGVTKALEVRETSDKVDVATEVTFGERCRADIRVRLGGGHELLIECKRSAPVRARQIDRYVKQSPPGAQIGVITTHFDTSRIDRLDVPVVTTEKLFELLGPYRDRHPYLADYTDWLQDLMERREQQRRGALSTDTEERSKALSTRVGQWALMHALMEPMVGEYTWGTNGGGEPWTQFAFSNGKDSDRLFYRIDRYSDGYYVSLRQYLRDTSHPAWEGKSDRLEDLRRFWKEAVDEENSDLQFREPNNRGTYESEVACIMLSKNGSERIVAELPALHEAFTRRLQENDWHLHAD